MNDDHPHHAAGQQSTPRPSDIFPVAIAPGLLLRLLEPQHADDLTGLFTAEREHLAVELPWLSQPFAPADVLAYIQAGLDRRAVLNGFRAGVWLDDRLAGCVSLHALMWEDGRASLGYWLASAFERRGIITRACAFVIAHAFNDLQLERLEILCASDNIRSRRVAERLGFQQEGILRRSWRRQGELVDQVLYSLLRGEPRPA